MDLYKEVAAFRFLLSLPNYKLKTVEAFLGISRSDPYNGGELIEVYRHYGRTGDKEALLSLKQHNYEDVADMPALCPCSPTEACLKAVSPSLPWKATCFAILMVSCRKK